MESRNPPPPQDPVSGIRQVPLDVTAQRSNAEIKAALERQRQATDALVTAACDSARASRKATSGQMKSVRVGEPVQEADVTKRFNAIRANIK